MINLKEDCNKIFDWYDKNFSKLSDEDRANVLRIRNLLGPRFIYVGYKKEGAVNE